MDLTGWLIEQKLAAAAYDAETLLAAFLQEMEKGLAGNDSSMAMLPAYLEPAEKVPDGQAVAVVDAGGTNLRVGLAEFDAEGRIEVSNFSKQAMPGRDHEISADEFYGVLADALLPFADRFEQIGFCFSYVTEIEPNHDGRLLHWTKEIKIPELVGRHVGSGLIDALGKRGIKGRQVVVLNDTVATLLAGLAQGQTFHASSYVGFILGTGTNTAYVEHNRNILKADGLDAARSQIINTESGGFAGFERGPLDRRLDADSENPGGHLFEKSISGAYLGNLTLEVLQQLAQEHIFSDAGAAALSIMKELSTIHIDNLTAENGRDTGVLETEVFTDADRQVMKQVFSSLVDRAALFTAVNMAAAVIKSGEGHDAARPVCINIDGSTYYKTFSMPEKVQARLKDLLAPRGLHIRCIHVDDAPVIGAAIAGLTAFRS